MQPAWIHTGHKTSATSWIKPLQPKADIPERYPGFADFQMSRIPSGAETLMAALAPENTSEYFPGVHQSFAPSPDSWIFSLSLESSRALLLSVPSPGCSTGTFSAPAPHPMGCPGRKSLGITLSPSQGMFVTCPGAQGQHPGMLIPMLSLCPALPAGNSACCAFQRRLLELQ